MLALALALAGTLAGTLPGAQTRAPGHALLTARAPVGHNYF